MKQAIKKARDLKAPANKLENVTKNSKEVKANALQQQDPKKLNRFLEASCDCV